MKSIGTFFGYISTATVISLGLGLAFLWSSNRLDDEKMFRMVALLHDVDVDRIDEEAQAEVGEVPSEEPSLADVEWQRQVLARNHEVKMEALRRNKLIFDAALKDLVTNTERFHEIAEKLESRLSEDGKLAAKKNLDKVVSILQQQKPDQAKDEILKILEEDKGTENVIKILNNLNQSKLKKIVQQFTEESEKDKLHSVLGVMLAGGLEKDIFETAMEELKGLKSQQ